MLSRRKICSNVHTLLTRTKCSNFVAFLTKWAVRRLFRDLRNSAFCSRIREFGQNKSHRRQMSDSLRELYLLFLFTLWPLLKPNQDPASKRTPLRTYPYRAIFGCYTSLNIQ